MLDKLGRKIEAGDLVCYSTYHRMFGSTLRVTKALEVTEEQVVVEYDIRRWSPEAMEYRNEKTKFYLTNASNLLKVN